MATAIIPIVVAAAPLLQPLINSLIIHVEKLFGAKTGTTKFDNVLQATLKTATDLSTAGKIPGTLDPATIAMMVEAEVQSLKAAGVLTPEIATQIVNNTSAAKMAIAGVSQPLKVTGNLTIGGN